MASAFKAIHWNSIRRIKQQKWVKKANSDFFLVISFDWQFLIVDSFQKMTKKYWNIPETVLPLQLWRHWSLHSPWFWLYFTSNFWKNPHLDIFHACNFDRAFYTKNKVNFTKNYEFFCSIFENGSWILPHIPAREVNNLLQSSALLKPKNGSCK